MKWSILLLLCFALVWGCREKELEPLPFFEVGILQPEAGYDLGTVRLSGNISRSGNSVFEDHGFLWSETPAALEGMAAGAYELSRQERIGDGVFIDSLPGLDLDQPYFFRAYARSGGRTVLSDTIAAFSFKFEIETDPEVDLYNDQAWVSGFVLGLQNLRVAVEEHGHVLSRSSTPLPELHPDSASVLGIRAEDGLFVSHFTGLEFNTTYYAWAYVKAGGSLYFSEHPVSFRTQDGWRPGTAFPDDITYALAQSIKGKGYLVFGCKESGGCSLSGNVNSYLWEFNPAGDGSWAQIGPLPDFVSLRFGALSFVIDEELFIGFGHHTASNSLLSDCWKTRPQDNTGVWELASLYDTASFRRRDAVAFVLKDDMAAYIGTGMDSDNKPLNDFWEFTPSRQGADAWRRVAGMKLLEHQSADTLYQGRTNAVAFTLGSYGYAGGGNRAPTLYLRDFWMFTPPSNTQDTGFWSFHSFFPGEPRSSAVVFTIGDKAYYGTGLSDNEGFHKDLWEFDPSQSGQEAWRKVTEFQGAPRDQAIGFSIGNNGYVGTGDSLIFIGRSTTTKSTRDIWKYHPE